MKRRHSRLGIPARLSRLGIPARLIVATAAVVALAGCKPLMETAGSIDYDPTNGTVTANATGFEQVGSGKVYFPEPGVACYDTGNGKVCYKP